MDVEHSEKVAFLRKIHLFHGLEEAELNAVAEKLRPVSRSAEDVIFEENSKSESFYLIYGGSVRITRRGDRREVQLARLVKNDYFGEMGLIARRKRSGRATALTDTSLLVLDRQDFELFYKRFYQLRLNFEHAIQSRKLARSMQFKWLRPDESIYFIARKHPIVLYQKLVWPIFALSVPVFLVYAWFAIAPYNIAWIAALVALLAIGLWILWLVVDWGNDYYIVTDRRVVWLEKVVGIYDSRQESPLNTILSVGVETKQLGRFLDYGDVIVRTWVGKIPFNDVSQPEQAQHMIEEYWNRTKEQAVGMEKEAMKDAIRRRLGIPTAAEQQPKPASQASVPVRPARPPRKKSGLSLLRILGASTLRLRYETGESVFYRKHWIVLIQQAAIPLLGLLAAFVIFVWRQIRLFQIPETDLVQIVNGALVIDTVSLAILFTLVPLFAWLVYEVMDWSNDQYQVTPEQIIDLDRRPFGTQTRNAAQLENILGIEYRRLGILGEIFNYGSVYITVGGTKLIFEDVVDPATVQADIDRRREARRAKQDAVKIAAERERMAEWLVTYHGSVDEIKREEQKQKKDGKSG